MGSGAYKAHGTNRSYGANMPYKAHTTHKAHKAQSLISPIRPINTNNIKTNLLWESTSCLNVGIIGA